MTMLQILTLCVGLANCFALACRVDSMTWQTHPPRVWARKAGIAAITLGGMWLALHDPDPQMAFIAEITASIILLHTLPRPAELRQVQPVARRTTEA